MSNRDTCFCWCGPSRCCGRVLRLSTHTLRVWQGLHTCHARLWPHWGRAATLRHVARAVGPGDASRRGEEVALSRPLRGRSTSPFQGISMNPSPVCSSWDAFPLPSTTGTALTIHDTSTFCIPQRIHAASQRSAQTPQQVAHCIC